MTYNGFAVTVTVAVTFKSNSKGALVNSPIKYMLTACSCFNKLDISLTTFEQLVISKLPSFAFWVIFKSLT